MLPFDILLSIVRFFGRSDAEQFRHAASELDKAFELNPAIVGARRRVSDMEIFYNGTNWTVNRTKPLPLVKPPRTIVGFGDISIAFSAQSKTNVSDFNFIEYFTKIIKDYKLLIFLFYY